MRFHIMTLFPEIIQAYGEISMMKKATSREIIQILPVNIRDYAANKHRKVDDAPFGGGDGMVLTPQPVVDCHEAVMQLIPDRNKKRTIYVSPKGRTLTQQVAIDLAEYEDLILLCGHYEGIDQRALDLVVDEEISIGDYVLTGGELAALVIVDSVARLKEGVLRSPSSYEEESFYSGLLEYPHYSRPASFRGIDVPEILLSGHHKNIEQWRREQSLKVTWENRPDLLENAVLSRKDQEYIKSLRGETHPQNGNWKR